MIGLRYITLKRSSLIPIELSSAGGGLYWNNTSDADHAAGMSQMASNDTAEIYFGAMTGQIQFYGRI